MFRRLTDYDIERYIRAHEAYHKVVNSPSWEYSRQETFSVSEASELASDLKVIAEYYEREQIQRDGFRGPLDFLVIGAFTLAGVDRQRRRRVVESVELLTRAEALARELLQEMAAGLACSTIDSQVLEDIIKEPSESSAGAAQRNEVDQARLYRLAACEKGLNDLRAYRNRENTYTTAQRQAFVFRTLNQLNVRLGMPGERRSETAA